MWNIHHCLTRMKVQQAKKKTEVNLQLIENKLLIQVQTDIKVKEQHCTPASWPNID